MSRSINGKKESVDEITGKNKGEENCIVEQLFPEERALIVRSGQQYFDASLSEYGLMRRIAFDVEIPLEAKESVSQLEFDFNTYDSDHKNPYHFSLENTDSVSVMQDGDDLDAVTSVQTAVKNGKLILQVRTKALPVPENGEAEAAAAPEEKATIHVTIIHFIR